MQLKVGELRQNHAAHPIMEDYLQYIVTKSFQLLQKKRENGEGSAICALHVKLTNVYGHFQTNTYEI